MRIPPVLTPLVVLACAVSLVGAGCSSAPPKKRRTVLMTEYDDQRVGKQASTDVAAQVGLLDDPELQAYVSGIGKKLLRGIPRRFDYQFSVIDQVEPNAFALPGGYIFISRGLLTLANNEDELACVIGHEITHAAHRHSAAQQELQKRSNKLAMPWHSAAWMARYGRDMERDADKGGQILCAAAGYDPMGLSTFLDSLSQAERLRVGYSRGPGFFDTHPGSRERASVNAVRASEMRWRRDPSLGDTRASLLAKIDGMALDQRPEAGVFVGDEFIHPDLDFRVRFPSGWSKSNTANAVGAAAPEGDAIVFLQADSPKGEPQEIAEQWVAKTQEEAPLELKESKPVKIGEIDAWRIRVDGGSFRGRTTAYVTFLPYRDATWRIQGMARAFAADRYLGRTLNVSRSFRPLTDEERTSIEVPRLQLVEAYPGESLEAVGRRAGSTWNVQDAAVYNGVFIDHRFRGGELVKVSRIERYVPVAARSAGPAGP